MLSSASDKTKLFAISLPVFPSRNNQKLYNISVTPKMVKKVRTNLDSSKASGLDCVPLVVLKNCESEGFIGGACIQECQGKIYS